MTRAMLSCLAVAAMLALPASGPAIAKVEIHLCVSYDDMKQPYSGLREKIMARARLRPAARRYELSESQLEELANLAVAEIARQGARQVRVCIETGAICQSVSPNC